MEEDHEEHVSDLNDLWTNRKALDFNDLALPWERPGAARRDCTPHRGKALVWLATAAFVCGLLSFLLGAPGFIGLPLGVAAYILAGRDLDSMERRLMDPRGREDTEVARRRGIAGAVMSILGLVFYPCFVFAFLLLWAVAQAV
jgi:hypothetical protein